MSYSLLFSIPSQADSPAYNWPIILPFSSNNGDPDEPLSVVPISQPLPVPWLPPPISHTWVPFAFTFSAPELSRQIFMISPLGWCIPTSNNGLVSELSHPAKTTSQEWGIASKSFTKAKSEVLLLAFNSAPLSVKLVCRLPLTSPVPHTGAGLTQLKRMDQRAGSLFCRQWLAVNINGVLSFAVLFTSEAEHK